MVLEATQVIAQRAVFAKDLDERQRLLRYQKSLNYYRGKHENPFLDPDVNFITANYCRLTVDKGVAFLFGKEPIFEQDPFETTPMEETIRQIWHANKKMTLLKNIGLNGGIFGDVFVALRVGDGSLGKIKNTAIPMIENIDPALVTVEWDPRNFQHETSFVIEWEAKNILEDGTEESVIFRQEIQEVSPGSWVIRDLRKRSQDADFVLERRVEWPWKWPPILHWQNLPEPNAYYGDSDLTEDIFAIQDAINFTLSNIGVILKNHAHPKTIGIGFLEDIMRTGPSKMSIIEDPDAKVFNLEMISDLGSSVQFFKDLVTTWHEIARIPEAATG
nr:phage portal protein [Anaerolineae bacterium]